MEFFILISVFILFCSMLFKIASKSKADKLPPGPRKLPIIGNLHQLASSGSLVHRSLAGLATKYGPLIHLQLGEISTMVVSSTEVMKEMMTEHGTVFENRPHLLAGNIIFYGSANVGLSPYGEYWRTLRKICTLELLNAKRVQTFRSIREEEVLKTVKSISSQEGSVVNLSRMLASLAFSITTRSAFGKSGSRYHDQFWSAMNEVTELMGGFDVTELFPSVKILGRITGIKYKLESVHKKLDEVIQRILDEHRLKRSAESRGGINTGEANEDLVDVLLRVQESEGFGAALTNDNMKSVIFEMFFVGGESTSNTMDWAMAEMIKNSGVLKRAQDEVRRVYGDTGNVDESRLHELKYLQAVIKETLRLHPAGPLVPREPSEDCEIYGWKIPAKTRIIINLTAVMQDPKHWIEPEKFKAERFLDSEFDFRGQNFTYIPFGSGRKICPGSAFAMGTIQIALAQILYHIDWKLPDGLTPEQLDMTEFFAMIVRRKEDLLLIPVPYSNPSPI